MSRRRATGTHINHFNKMGKSDLVWNLKEHGAVLQVTKVDVGEWNERRVFSMVKADGTVYESWQCVMKGERVNWDDMHWEFEKELTGFTKS